MKQKKTTVPTGCFYVYWMRPKYFPFSLTPHTHQFFFVILWKSPFALLLRPLDRLPIPTTSQLFFFYIFPPTVYVCCMLDTP